MYKIVIFNGPEIVYFPYYKLVGLGTLKGTLVMIGWAGAVLSDN